ncbi:MAG: hypothetical protein HOW73_16435 [Polyangiaceae bacterium]|nr:hypothetical protein [Polyangiaceae bacterium]
MSVRMRQVIRMVPLLVAGGVGCGRGAEGPDGVPTIRTSTSSTPRPPARVEPASVSVAAIAAPRAAVIDGDLAEWGSLLPGSNVGGNPMYPEAIGPSGGTKVARPTLPNAVNPTTSAASHVAIALRDDQVLVAAELGEKSGDAVWLGIGVPAPNVPAIGHGVRGGYTYELQCEHEDIDLPEGEVGKGPPLTPEAAAACRKLLERHASLVETQRQRFVRRYRLDERGVSIVEPDGSTKPIEGAVVAAKPTASGGKALEASFPVKGLPRMVDAPVEWLRISARTLAGAMTPDIASDPWTWAKLPAPVSFDKNGDIRAKMFALINSSAFFPPALSYQPGDSVHVESVDYKGSRSTVGPSEHVLYQKRFTFKDIEIGVVSAWDEGIAIQKEGKLLDILLPLGLKDGWGAKGELKAVVAREDDVHIIVYTPWQWTVGSGSQGASWGVISVSQDGTFLKLVNDEEGSYTSWDFESVDGTATPDYTRLIVRGTYTDYNGGNPLKKGREQIWQWDPKGRIYTFTEKDVPPPRKKAAAKR